MGHLVPALTRDIDFIGAETTTTIAHGRKTISPFYPIQVPLTNGRGEYILPNPKANFPRGVKIRDRLHTGEISVTPGPGTYDAREWPHTATPPMGPRPEIVFAEPGCGADGKYQISRDLSDGPKFTIRARQDVSSLLLEDPGYIYNHPVKTGQDSPSFSLKMSRTMKPIISDVPGPGAYNAKDIQSTHRLACSIHPLLQIDPAKDKPLDFLNTRQFPEIKQRSLHHSVKTGGCWDHDESIPGPDFCPGRDLHTRSCAIRAIIPEKPPGTDNPGPGTYSIPSGAGRNSEPRFTLKGPADRGFLPKTAGDMPGPGHYDIRSRNGLPLWTIGERTLQRAREKRARSSIATMKATGPRQGRLASTV
jgi:hypothetical protein